MQHLLRYVQGTKSYNLLFGKTCSGLEMLIRLYGYSDSDFVRSRIDRKSVSGYVFLLNEVAVAYVSRKQTSVATSTTKAEYVAITTAAKEGVWLQHLLKSIM